MSRLFKTKSGTYKEADLAVVVWKNPKKSKKPQSRFLETMSAPNSNYPMAFPLVFLKTNYAWKDAKHANSFDEFNKYIECTEVRGGADAIRQRAAMPSGEERRAVYQDQLDQVNAAGKRRGGSRIMVMMEVLPSVLEEVEIGSERM